jgi:hypothetical protein
MSGQISDNVHNVRLHTPRTVRTDSAIKATAATNVRTFAERERNVRTPEDPWWPLDANDPWGTPCGNIDCHHPMREHILDWDLDPPIDCRHEDCVCPGFELLNEHGAHSHHRRPPL